MDEHADGAHRGMTVQMEQTTCKDPLMDEAAVVSEFDFILLFSLVSDLYGCLAMQICFPHAISIDTYYKSYDLK